MGRMDGSTPPAGRGRTGRGLAVLAAAVLALLGGGVWIAAALREATDTPVSYTHLTLPTTERV